MTLILLALAWLAALAAVALWGVPWWLVPALLAACVPLVAIRLGRHPAILLAAAALLSAGGAGRFSAWEHRDTPTLASFVGQQVTLDGVTVSEPEPSDFSSSYTVRVDALRTTDLVARPTGKVRLSLPADTEYLPGTRLRLTGQLTAAPVFPDFDYRSFLNRQDVVATMSRPAVDVLDQPPDFALATNITRVRLTLDHSLQRALPEPEASLAGGIAFGRDGNLPDGLYQDFRDVGLAHIVAVSGSNVSLVAALTFVIFTWLVGRRLAFIPVAVTVLGYLLIAGLSASVVRAGIMASVYLLGAYLGRQRSSLSALAAAAIVMTASQPSAALDLGFQLSLAATAGLIAFGPWIRFGMERGAAHVGVSRIPTLVVQVMSLSLAATVATLPIVWLNFGRLSLVSPLTNIVVEPVFLVAFWLSAASAVAGLAWPPAGWAIALAAYYPLSFITWFARATAALPFAAIDVPQASGTIGLAAYAAMAAAGWFAYRRFPPALPARGVQHPPRRMRLLQGAVGMAAIAGAVVPVSLLSLRAPGEATFTLLDTGSSSTVLITTPHGSHVLINAGPTAILVAREVGAVLPHWEHSIDDLIILGTSTNESGALPALNRRYVIDRTIDEPALSSSERFTVDGVTFAAIPAEGSGVSAVGALRITFGTTSFLIPAEQSHLEAAASAAPDVLVVPHSASQATDLPLVRALSPAIALIPVGDGTYDPQPAQSILDALSTALILRTDNDGRITLHSDGQSLEFSTAR